MGLPASTFDPMQSLYHSSQNRSIKTLNQIMTLLSLSPTVASQDNYDEILSMTHKLPL